MRCSCRLLLASLVAAQTAGKLVEYDFHIRYFEVNPDGYGYAYVRGINHMFPGPDVRVRNGDHLQIHVYNHLPTEYVSFHWHGFEMRGSWAYDGAVGITQCGIAPHTNFTYDWVVDEHPGTYQYHEHAHMSHVGARGLFGALIVEPSEGERDPWEYDQDASLLLFDYWPKSIHEMDLKKWAGLSRIGTVSREYNDVGLNTFHNLLLNGKGGFALLTAESPGPGWVSKTTRVEDLYQLAPKAGETWRLRVQNVGALFTIRFRIDGHRLTVVQADASDVEPYVCDALSMSSGERFDVLVTFDQTPGSYWMRLETLEAGYGYHHGQLAVLRYESTPEGVLPDMGYPSNHDFFSAPHLVTINCVDQGPISETCQPITALRLRPRPNQHGPAVVPPGGTTHDFEVNFRGYGKPDDSHFTRVIDLSRTPNTFGADQFDGEYVQFLTPSVPYSHVNGTRKGEFTNTLRMEVSAGETVRIFLQIQDRTAHPWHMHGHKFSVLGSGQPNFAEDCDIVFCRSAKNLWLSRDGPPELLDPSVAPMKDTVNVPPGGWVVIQFAADNPGWWFFHCHMVIHHHDGMAVVMEEDRPNIPAHYTDADLLNSRGFPTCRKELRKLEKRRKSRQPGGMSCSCWQDPEKFYGNELRSGYKCAKAYLCGHAVYTDLDPKAEATTGRRNRASGRGWRWVYTAILLLLTACLFGIRHRTLILRRRRARAIANLGVTSRAREKENESDLHLRPTNSLEANLKALELPQVRLPMQFVAACHMSAGVCEVKGGFSPGTVVAIVGSSDETKPWLRFFCGHSQEDEEDSKVIVTGDVSLGGEELRTWGRQSLRQVCAYIANGETELLRLGSTAADVVSFPMRVSPHSDVHAREVNRRTARLLMIFDLLAESDHLVAELSPAKLRRVIVAGSMSLPRGLIVLEDPLTGLDPRESSNTLFLFQQMANITGAIIIFSATSLSKEGRSHVKVMLECSPSAIKMVTDGSKFDPRSSSYSFFTTSTTRPSVLKTFLSCSLTKHCRRFLVLLDAEFVQGFMYEYVTRYHFLESVGVGLCAGLVWVQCNSIDTQVALSETVGLLFYTTAVWTVPPVFQALACTPGIISRVKHDALHGHYRIHMYIAVLWFSNLFVSFIWVALWQSIAYSLADVGADLPRLLVMHVVMVLNVLAMRGVGMVLGILIPRAAAGAVVCNIIAQMQMLTNGFYTKLNPNLKWIVELSIPRLAFRALQKLEYSWKDTFEVHPMMGIGGAGFPCRFIPAEITGFFGLMRDRHMNVMQSPEPDDFALPEVIRLLVTSILSFAIFGLALRLHVRGFEANNNSWVMCLGRRYRQFFRKARRTKRRLSGTMNAEPPFRSGSVVSSCRSGSLVSVQSHTSSTRRGSQSSEEFYNDTWTL